MRLLLDTHMAIWWLSGDVRMPQATRAAVEEAPEAMISAVSLWELAIKQGTGRLDLPSGFVDALLEDFTELAVRSEHVRALRGLPPIHRDPFDRMLVAQAIVEGSTLVTRDPEIMRYGVPVIPS
jgi:PIN domain nuclease of toxin-antitoxin system